MAYKFPPQAALSFAAILPEALMHSAFALAAAFFAAAPISPGTQLSYSGNLVPVKAEQNLAIKRFDLTYVIFGEAPDIGWALNEAGRGGWTWLDRFGRLAATSPALLYEREDGRAVVPLSGPIFTPPIVRLERGASWEEDRLEYRVSGEAARAGRTCWVIEVRSPYGHKRTLWVEQGSGLVAAMRETVFMGQGQEHRLTLELTD